MFSGGFPGFFGGFGEEDSRSEPQKEVDTQELYNILGVTKTANSNEIKTAFRKACVKGEYRHPDKGGDPEKFKKLNEAYEVLNNPEKRDIYDKYGLEGLKNQGQGGGDFGDIFSSFFGGGGRAKGPKKCKPKLVPLKVTLEDIYLGKQVKVEVPRKRNCESCDGKGGQGVTKCTTCKGKGMVIKMVQLGPGMYSQSQSQCSNCRGEGETVPEKDRCKACKGKKIVDNTKTIIVDLEPGVYDGYDYTYAGEADEIPGVQAGDLYIRVQVEKHKTFTRKGADLFLTKKITLLEALTGYSSSITHLDKQVIIVSTIPGDIISHNQTKTVKGKGLPFFKNNHIYGNLYLQFEVEFPKPKSLKTEDQEALKKILPGKPSSVTGKGEPSLLSDYIEDETNPNPEGGKGGAEEEQEESGPQGGQKVQCQQS